MSEIKTKAANSSPLGLLGFDMTTIFTILLFLVFCALTALFPYSGDDWTWGSNTGIERLRIFFSDHNGRYAGNLLVLLLTRNKFLDVLSMSGCYTFACWLCHRYSPYRTTSGFLFAALLFFLMPRPIFSQAIVWTSGFVNYVPSALITASYLYLVRHIADHQPPCDFSWKLPAALGFFGAMFMENITVFNICLAVAVLGYTWLKFRKIYRAHLGFFFGAILGAALVFASPVYRSIAADTDYYRSTSRTIYQAVIMATKHSQLIMDYLIYNNPLFCIIVTVLLIIAAWVGCSGSRSKKCCFARASSFANVFTLGLIVYLHFYPQALHSLSFAGGALAFILNIAYILIPILYLASIVTTVYLCVPRDHQFRMLMPLYCIPVSLGPLLFVTPIGPRCVYIGYLLMMIFATDLFCYVIKHCHRVSLFHKHICTGLCVMVLLQAVLYFSIFIPIHHWDNQRTSFAKFQSEQGNPTVYVCRLPHEEYLHHSAPDHGNLIKRYIAFHGLNPDTTFEFVPVEELGAMISQKMH